NTSAISPSNSLNINVNARITGTNQQLEGYIPTTSTQMLSFDAIGTLIKRYLYTANDANDRRGPIIQTAFCNNPPAIDLIPKQIKPVDIGLFSVNMSGITDGDKCSHGVTISAVSSNPEIVSVNAVNYTSCNKIGTLDLAPITDGEATITVSVSELSQGCTPTSTTTSFVVSAYKPNQIIIGRNDKFRAYQTATAIVFDFSKSESFENGTNLSIANMAGKVLFTNRIVSTSKIKTININDLNPGIYIISCLTNMGNYKEKFVVN
ncbi:MAG: T9SS type A sorting domain-containing protein, partial [Bacteroidia bacterium]|nr:T9SS type A sorting domain-containing protein [Bacteroidia bacterium]